MSVPATYRHIGFVDGLSVACDLPSAWRRVFMALPRHTFIPDRIWRQDGSILVPVFRDKDEDAWLDLCYTSDWVATQVDDGRPAGLGLFKGRDITSSCSDPKVVAMMLQALNVADGMSVLEIGTGTGWNAALLAERLGDDKVTTIEVDGQVAERARRALKAAGHRVHVVTGDGAAGYKPNAPYDRVIATAGVHEIPYAWVEQTKPGGLILVPWATAYHNGALLSLEVAEDGSASGRVVGNVQFMMLRDQRFASVLDPEDEEIDQADLHETQIHPYEVVGEFDASFAIGLKVPGCRYSVQNLQAGAYTVWFSDAESGSWACIDHERGAADFPVHQFGPRRLWDEVEAAYQWWDSLGRPEAGRWGITVTPKGRHIWLDSPDPGVRAGGPVGMAGQGHRSSDR